VVNKSMAKRSGSTGIGGADDNADDEDEDEDELELELEVGMGAAGGTSRGSVKRTS
jgi:hypothetical protein